MTGPSQKARDERGPARSGLALLPIRLLLGLVAACGPDLEPRSTPPANLTPLNPPPNGEPEPVRYRVAYEAFWWNCAIVKSRDLNARCPALCSGTTGAAPGCGQGATDAENDIDDLIRGYGESRTQQYLQRLVREAGAEAKIRASYFTDGPVSASGPTGVR